MRKVTGTARLSRDSWDDIDAEIAQLRDLSVKGLRARWRTAFRGDAPAHLAPHLLFTILAYHQQTEVMGGLDSKTERYLERMDQISSPAAAVPLTQAFERQRRKLTPGTVLTREWNGQHHRVMVQEDGFSWEGRTYRSLTEIAKAITGTKWNGPRFFGLRDKKHAEAAE